MNKEIKEQWLAELRDEKLPWVQGNGQLMSDFDEACCLGVLTDIGVREGIVPPWEINRDGWSVEDEAGTLPPTICEWAELDTNPVIKYTAPDGEVLSFEISILNDGGNLYRNGNEYLIPPHTFKEIAKYIEEQF